MAELGGAGIAGQDVLEMVRVKEVLWRQEVRMAASCFAAVSCMCLLVCAVRVSFVCCACVSCVSRCAWPPPASPR
jgi:hypothetical protein